MTLWGGGEYEYSQKFANDIASLVSKCTGNRFAIYVPFHQKHKYEVFDCFIGKEDLFAKTWSSKTEGMIQDGATRSCIARRLAAKLAGLRDDTEYVKNKLDFSNILTDAQLKDFAKISDEEFGEIFASPKRPTP